MAMHWLHVHLLHRCTGLSGSPDCSSADTLEPPPSQSAAASRPELPAGAAMLGCRAFKDAVADGTNRILADPTLVRDGRRVCMMIAHVRRRVGEEKGLGAGWQRIERMTQLQGSRINSISRVRPGRQ